MLLWSIKPKIDWNRLLLTIESKNLVAIMIVSNSGKFVQNPAKIWIQIRQIRLINAFQGDGRRQLHVRHLQRVEAVPPPHHHRRQHAARIHQSAAGGGGRRRSTTVSALPGNDSNVVNRIRKCDGCGVSRVNLVVFFFILFFETQWGEDVQITTKHRWRLSDECKSTKRTLKAWPPLRTHRKSHHEVQQHQLYHEVQ